MSGDVVPGAGVSVEGSKLLANVTVVKLETSVVTVGVLAAGTAFDVWAELVNFTVVGDAWLLLAKVNVVTLESSVVTVVVLAVDPISDI